MPLTTAQDLLILHRWSWLRAYARNKQDFIEIGNIVFQAITATPGNPPPGPSDLEHALAVALQSTGIFKKLCVVRLRSYARSGLYPHFALGLARYMLDNDWAAVTQP
jgi:hypothetical protein